MVWGGLFTFYEYLSHVHRLSPTLRGPSNIILTSLLLGVWMEFPSNLGVFCLDGWALLATEFIFACGLATTLSVAICCNTTIRPEFVHCALVACGVKYVCLLATTLGIAIRCNTTISLESVYYTVLTGGHVFVCCSATTLDIPIHWDIAIRSKSVRCVLVIIKILPICRAHLR